MPPNAVHARQSGAILIMYAFMLVIVLGFAGLVMDLGLVYYRKVQLQNAADAIALAAAQRLNGTLNGVTTAVNAAVAVAASRHLGIEGRLPWNTGTQGNALRFSANPDAAPGDW
ncbi:MAG TPA: pilus assembly protein TadG-related protein, partial [Pseudoduganella sp.]